VGQKLHNSTAFHGWVEIRTAMRSLLKGCYPQLR
jgi:hypothetical protein